MSFLTPPPEFDECTADATSLLNHNACLPDIFYPSPSSSSRTACRHGSYSPQSPSSQHDQTYLDTDDHSPNMFESNGPIAFESTTSSTQPGAMYTMDVPFNMYEQPQWNSFQTMPTQYPPLSHQSHDEATFFPYPTTDSSISANMIPATPQPVASPQYNFNGSLHSSYMAALASRQAFTPDTTTGSMSISSRDCSPNPSHISVTNSHLHRRQCSRSSSIASANSPLSHYGIPVRAPGSAANSAPQAWRCAYPNCTSRATFIRGCDLRKHYNRHSKHLFCRVDGCPQSEAAAMAAAQAADPHCKDSSQLVLSGGFSSKKDRARHEAKHNPGIQCEWSGPNGESCGRVFSRMDNMKDHVRRIHQKGQQLAATTGGDADRAKKRKSR